MKNKLTVVIPVYNAEQYIEETIHSVLTQTYRDFEVVIVNDGSTDRTREIIDEIAQSDERIRIINKPNTGVCETRNKGADEAKANYLCFLDADDIFLPTNLEMKVAFLEQNPDIGLVHADVALIDEHSNKINQILSGKSGDILDDLLLWNGTCIPAPSSIMVRREVFEKVGKWDASFSTAADQDFFFRVAAHYKIGRIPEVLTQYRIHMSGMSRNIEVMEKDHIGVYKKAAQQGLFKSFWFRRKCFSNLYLILAGSWWKDGNSKPRGLWFALLSCLIYPPQIKSIFKKLF